MLPLYKGNTRILKDELRHRIRRRAAGHARLTAELIATYTRPGLWEDRIADSYLTATARSAPEQTAVIDHRGAWTFAQIDAQVEHLASALQALGVRRGDVVSWQLPNWVEAAVVHMAALRLGAISNPIVAIYRHAEVSFILRQARSKVVFVPSSYPRVRLSGHGGRNPCRASQPGHSRSHRTRYRRRRRL